VNPRLHILIGVLCAGASVFGGMLAIQSIILGDVKLVIVNASLAVFNGAMSMINLFHGWRGG
jgi:ribosomal protein L30E